MPYSHTHLYDRPSKHAYVGPTSASVGIGAATSPSGRRRWPNVVPTTAGDVT